MTWILLAMAGAIIIYFLRNKEESTRVRLDHLPDRFVVFDLETTGLDASKHEIIEIGAIA